MNSSTSPTRKLAQFVSSANYSQIPVEVREAAKGYVLDSITNMIGGSRIAPAKIVLELFGEMGGKAESTVLATGQKMPCLQAIYVNSALANMLDFDDCYLYISHPGATVIPPALAMGEKLGLSGQELISAVVLGYEVSLRVCDAIRATPERFHEVWGISTWQIFGAVTVAAKFLRLDADGVATAFGHAGMHATVPYVRKMGLEPADRPFTWLKNNYGWASMGGVLAAELVARGSQGNQTIFDGPKGFWVMAGSDQCDFDRLTDGLGEEYLMPATGIKPYASCRWTHTSLDALHDVIGRHQIDPRKIEAISVRSISALRDMFDVPRPAHVVDAQFSLAPLIALSLAGYSPAQGIAEDRLGDSVVQSLIAKIRIDVADDADRKFHEEREMPSTVSIRMTDGTIYEATQSIAKGEPERRLTFEELAGKFLDVTKPVIGSQRAVRILDAVERLEQLKDVREITGLD